MPGPAFSCGSSPSNSELPAPNSQAPTPIPAPNAAAAPKSQATCVSVPQRVFGFFSRPASLLQLFGAGQKSHRTGHK